MKIYNILNRVFLLAAIMVIFAACQEEDPVEQINPQLTGTTKVFFDPSNVGSVMESPNVVPSADGTTTLSSESTVEVGVIRSGVDVSSEMTVNFTYTVTYNDATDFFDAGADASSTVNLSDEGTVVIPAGSSRGSIVIAAVDDQFATGDKTVSITITGATGAELGFSESDPKLTQEVTVVEDDCSFNRPLMEGVFEVVMTGYFDNVAGGRPNVTYEIQVTQDPSDPLNFIFNDFYCEYQGDGEVATGDLTVRLITCAKLATLQNGGAFGNGIITNFTSGSLQGNWDFFTSSFGWPEVDSTDPSDWVRYDDEKGTWQIIGLWYGQSGGYFGDYAYWNLTRVGDLPASGRFAQEIEYINNDNEPQAIGSIERLGPLK